jgi:hypothetical protein
MAISLEATWILRYIAECLDLVEMLILQAALDVKKGIMWNILFMDFRDFIAFRQDI